MKRAAKIVLLVLGALLLLAVGGTLWLLNDESLLRAQVERLATNAAGRPVSVARLEVWPGMTSRIRLEGLEVANTGWGRSDALLRVQLAEARVDISELFSAGVRIDQVELDGVQLDLEEDGSGQNNWTFDTRDGPAHQRDDTGEGDIVPWSAFKVTNFSLSHHSPDRAVPLQFEVAELAGVHHGDGAVNLNGEGAVGGYPLQLSAELKPLQRTLLDGGVAYRLELALGENQLVSGGTFEDLGAGGGINMGFQFSGPEFDWLLEQAALPAFSSGPFQASGSLGLKDPGVLVLALDGNFGSLQASASGQVNEWRRSLGLALDLGVSGPDLGALGQALGLTFLPASRFDIGAQLDLADGQFSFENLEVTVDGGHLGARGTLGAWPGLENTDLTLEAHSENLAVWSPLLGFERLSQEPFQLDARLRERSGTLHIDIPVMQLGQQEISLTGSVPPAHDRIALQVHLPTATGSQQSPGEIRLELDAQFPNLPDLAGASTSLDLNLPSLKAVEAYLDRQDLPDVPLQLSGAVQYLDDGLVFEHLQGHAGNSELALHGRVQLEPRLALKNLRFHVSGPDFRRLLDRPELEQLPAQFQVSGEAHLDDGRQVLDDVEIRLGGSSVHFDGTVDHIVRPRVADLAVRVESEDPRELLPFVRRFRDIELPGEPLEASFQLQSRPESLDFRNLQLRMEDSALSGDLSVGLGEVMEIRGRLDSGYFDLGWINGDRFADQGQPTQAPSPELSRVFSDKPLPLLSEYPLGLGLDIDARRLQLPWGAVQLKLGVQRTGNSLTIEPLEISAVQGGAISGSVEVAETDRQLSVLARGGARGFRLGLAVAPGQDPATYPAWDFEVDFNAAGATPREMARSANGELAVIVGEGNLSNTRLQLVFSDIVSELFNLINPMAERSPLTHLQCAVAMVELENGTARVDPLILQTDQLIASSTGTINLATEKLSMGFTTRPRQGIGISAGAVVNPFIRLGGTMAQPSITLDPTSAAISGSAAVATAGLSLLGKSLFDRFMRDQDPCGKVVAELRKLYAEDAVSAPQGE